MGPCDSTLELPLSLSKVRPLFLFCSSRGGGDFCYVLQQSSYLTPLSNYLQVCGLMIKSQLNYLHFLRDEPRQ